MVKCYAVNLGGWYGVHGTLLTILCCLTIFKIKSWGQVKYHSLIIQREMVSHLSKLVDSTL